MNNKLTKIGVIGLLVVLVMSLGAAAVFAQDEPVPDTDAQPALPYRHGGFGHHGHGGDRGGNNEALAEALGISVNELQAAREQVMVDRIAQAVEDGSLTQEEANTLLAMHALKAYIDKEAIMAQVLGMTAEEYEAAHEDGSIRDILADINPADLEARVQEATTATVQRAVAENVITQEQADLILQKLEEGLGMRGTFGGHRGFGGRGGFRGAPTSPESEEAGVLFTPFGA